MLYTGTLLCSTIGNLAKHKILGSFYDSVLAAFQSARMLRQAGNSAPLIPDPIISYVRSDLLYKYCDCYKMHIMPNILK